jgi:hypothetical protein
MSGKSYFTDDFTILSPGNNVGKWSDLNIDSINNLQISFQLKVDSNMNDWANILHITTTGNNCCSIGDRVPALWLNTDSSKGTYLHVTASTNGNRSINGNGNEWNNFYFNKGKSFITYVVITFYLNTLTVSFDDTICIADGNSNNLYYTFKTPLTEPSQSSTIYLKDEWYNHDYSYKNYAIKNITFSRISQIKDNIYVFSPYGFIYLKPSFVPFNWKELKEEKVVDSINNLKISFTIKITDRFTNWNNIFHITSTGNNCCEKGDRVPALWLNSDPNNGIYMHVSASTSNVGNNTHNFYFNRGNSFTANVILTWKNNEVTVNIDGNINTYNYGEDLIEPDANGSDAKIYLKDPWHQDEKVYTIKNFTISKINSIALRVDKFIFSPNSFITLRSNNVACLWQDLNIDTINNLKVSFIVKVTKQITNWCNILHISNDDTNWGGTIGTRVPGIWLGDGGIIYACSSTINNADEANRYTIPFNPPYTINVILTWLNGTLIVKINEKTIKNQDGLSSYDFSSSLIEPLPLAKVYIKDPWHDNDNNNYYQIKDLEITQINPHSYLKYQFKGCYENNTKGLTINNDVRTIKECAIAAHDNDSTFFSIMPVDGQNYSINYKEEKGIDYPGNDIRYYNESFNKCAYKCSITPGCNSYTLHRDRGFGCWLKSKNQNRTGNSNRDTYTKNADISSPVISCSYENKDKDKKTNVDNYITNSSDCSNSSSAELYVRKDSSHNILYENISQDSASNGNSLNVIWENLNIDSISNMMISFIIRVDALSSTDSMNIIHIMNQDNDDKPFALWVTTISTLRYSVETINKGMEYFNVEGLTLKIATLTKISIIIAGKDITVYAVENKDGVFSKNPFFTKNTVDSDLVEPSPTATIYIASDPFNSPDLGNFMVKSVSIIRSNDNMVCGRNNFCVGYEADEKVYCYGNSSQCLWGKNDCYTDNQCKGKYTLNSAKYTDNDKPKCSNIPNKSWRTDACPNFYDTLKADKPPSLKQDNFGYADTSGYEDFSNYASLPSPGNKNLVYNEDDLKYYFTLVFVFLVLVCIAILILSKLKII